MSHARFALPLTVILALAGCQSDAPYREGGGPVASTPQDKVQGDWMSADGVAISRFSGGGTFETLATDTGNKLAQGTYRFRDPATVDIEVTSLIRNSTSSVACAVISTSQLNCTSSAGQRFVLSRRRAA